MVSIVRETVNKLVIIENPLTKPVQFLPEHIVCDSDAISFNPTSFTIQAQSVIIFSIVFLNNRNLVSKFFIDHLLLEKKNVISL